MIWKSKSQPTADDMAVGIFDALVLTPHVRPPDGLELDERSAKLFESVAGVYQLATVMQVLLIEEKRSARIALAKGEFDRHIFGLPNPDDRQRHLIVTAGEALAELQKLFQPDSARMTWGARWLSLIGIENVNPIHAALISAAWMGFLVNATNALRKVAS